MPSSPLQPREALHNVEAYLADPVAALGPLWHHLALTQPKIEEVCEASLGSLDMLLVPVFPFSRLSSPTTSLLGVCAACV